MRGEPAKGSGARGRGRAAGPVPAMAGMGKDRVARGTRASARVRDGGGRLSGPPQRIFSVASPISARISEMIQKRITICGSCQPFFSKWWWIGAIRNTRRPVRLK